MPVPATLHTYRITGHEFGFAVNPFTIDASSKLRAIARLRITHPDLGIDTIERVVSPAAPTTTTTTTTTGIDGIDLQKQTVASLASYCRMDCRAKGVKVPYGAVPYLDAMQSMQTVDDAYGCDSGRSIVLYALSNLTGWRGDVAKAVKAELKRRLKAKPTVAQVDAANARTMDDFKQSMNLR